MPLYDLKCPKCKKVHKDKFLKRAEEVVYCEKCRAKLQKMPSKQWVKRPKKGRWAE